MELRAGVAGARLAARQALHLHGAERRLAQLAAGLHRGGAGRRLDLGREGAFLGRVALPVRCSATSRLRGPASNRCAKAESARSSRSRHTAASRREQAMSPPSRAMPGSRAHTTAMVPMQARGISPLSRTHEAMAARSAGVTPSPGGVACAAAGKARSANARKAARRDMARLSLDRGGPRSSAQPLRVSAS